jgi:hypothetical protein
MESNANSGSRAFLTQTDNVGSPLYRVGAASSCAMGTSVIIAVATFAAALDCATNPSTPRQTHSFTRRAVDNPLQETQTREKPCL